MSIRRPILRWIAIILVAAATVAAGTWLGLRLSSAVSAETAIGRISITVRPSTGGEVEAFVPLADWGVRSRVFDVPLLVRAELESIDRSALLSLAEGNSGLLGSTEDQLKQAARDAVIQAVIWAAASVLVLLVLVTLIWRRLRPRWAVIVAGVLITVLAYGAAGLKARSDLEHGALGSTTYFAQGDEISRILDLAEDPRFPSGYGSEFASIVRSISAVLGEAGLKSPDVTEIYAGSDLHANALVIRPLSRLVDDHPLLLAGDFGQRGGQAEATLIAPRVAAIGSRIVAVSGNHDSHGLMRTLARDGVTVLGQEGRLDRTGRYLPPPVIGLEGLKLAGFRDPLEYGGNRPNGPDRPVTAADFPDPDAVIAGWRRQLLTWFRNLPSRPDLVMVHQDGLAQWLARRLARTGYRYPLTLVTGHDHRQHIDRYGDIVVVDGGTIGAGGVFGAGTVSIGVARLRFDPATDGGAGRRKAGPPRLRAVDLIAVEPFTGAARATRVIVGLMCPGEDTCHVEPDQAQPAPGK